MNSRLPRCIYLALQCAALGAGVWLLLERIPG